MSRLTKINRVIGCSCGLLGGFLLVTSAFAADAAVDTINVSVPESCTVTTSSGSGETYNISMVNGQYKSDLGKTRLNVFCNTNDNFAIYAVGYSGDTLGDTDMKAASGGAGIATGNATGGDTSNWAMKVESVAGTGTSGSYTPIVQDPFGNFTAVPSDYTKVAEVASATTSVIEGAIDASYAIYLSPTQVPGAYTGKVRYTVVHPASAAAPTSFNTAYAAAGKSKVNGYYTMQDMSADICDAVNIFDEVSQTQLIDARDNKIYYVAKLKDGECWMTQNLDHDINASFAYTPDNTDIPANWTPDKSTYATSTTAWDMSSTGYNIQQSYDPGDKIWNGVTDSSGLTINNMTQGTNQHYHLGNYYNWSAAVAMNNTSAYTADSADVNQSICPKGWTLPKSDNITTAGSFQYLVNQYNWAGNSMTNPNMWASPLYFPLAGYWNGSSGYVAYYGGFWSSVVYSSSSAYGMYEYYSGDVYPANNSLYRDYGFSVRCVAREAGSTPGYVPTDLSDSGMTTMQQMTPEICAATAEGTEKQLRDERDNKTYWVAKLKDGKCWMTQNLDHDIDSTKTYTSNDTDVPADWKPDKSTYATSTTTWDTSTNGYNIQQSYDPGDKIWDGNPSSSTSITIGNMTQGTNQHYHLGNYYNWGAAVAMNNTSAYTTQNQDVNQSICPKGWMLPKSGTTNTSAGSFRYLVSQYNWTPNIMTNPNMWASPLYFPLAGNLGGSSNYVAYSGNFWSSIVYSSSFAYTLAGNYSGTVNPANNVGRYYGFSVRCVSR